MFDALFTTTTEYKKLSHALSGKGACALFGLPASGRAQVYAALCRQLDKPLCIVTPGEADCTVCHGDVKASELIPDRMAALHGNCMKCHEKHGKGPFRKDQCNQCHTK